MRGGQVTLFIIVGLVVFFAVAIFYLVIRVAEEEQLPQTALVSSTLSACIDTVVHDELLLFGASGGTTVFDERPSASIHDQRILYGITKKVNGNILPRAYLPPRYPDDGVSLHDTAINQETGDPFLQFQDGYFGDVNFPAICNKEGENSPQHTFACRYYLNAPPGTEGPVMQELFEEHIAQRVQSCASPNMFSDALGQEVTEIHDPTVHTTFTLTNTVVNLTYPVTVDGVSQRSSFIRTYNVRYLPLAQYVIDLAREETRNVTFNIAEDYQHIASYKEGFTLLVTRNAAPDADLVSVIDERSTIDGISYQFSFLVQHRTPMITPLSQDEAEDVTQDGMLRGTRIAIDPDDGPVTIRKIRDASTAIAKIVVVDEDGEEDWIDFV